MLSLCLVLMLSASVCSESVRETETWMPMKTTQTVAMSTRRGGGGGGPESSGDAPPDGSDFGFTDDDGDEDEEEDSDYYTDALDDDDDEFSGSGDGATTVTPEPESRPSAQPDLSDNKIPEVQRPARPTTAIANGDVDDVRSGNEIPRPRSEEEPGEEYPSNVLMSHASDDSVFSKTEVLAALIAGGAVGLMFAILLILLLIYRMKKKDEGSYDLGKKPIYKKAPTTEIYA